MRIFLSQRWHYTQRRSLNEIYSIEHVPFSCANAPPSRVFFLAGVQVEAVMEREKEVVRGMVKEGKKSRALLALKKMKVQEEALKKADAWVMRVEEQVMELISPPPSIMIKANSPRAFSRSSCTRGQASFAYDHTI